MPFQPLVHPIGGTSTSPVDPSYKTQVAMSIELPGGVLEPGQTGTLLEICPELLYLAKLAISCLNLVILGKTLPP